MLVRLERAAKYYGATSVLDNATLTVHPGERIGIVGRNGAGKSTLLRLIGGVEEPDDGRIARARDVRIGHLLQTHEGLQDVPLETYLMGAFTHIHAKWDEMKRLETAMSSPGIASDPERLDSTLGAYSRATEAFERGGGYESEAGLKETVAGLGFEDGALGRPIGSLSGGEQVRASLARLLLEAHDLLLLDEPTNHLDMSAIEWLERTLKGLPVALVIVSHDRSLLDAVSTRIVEVEDGRTESYKGNYSAYASQRTERRTRQEKLFEAQQKEIARLAAYVDKYRAGNRSTMAKSRERRLERMERIAPPTKSRELSIRMTARGETGRRVLEFEHVAKGYGRRKILDGLNLVVEPGDRLAVIGPNGCGKSTLLRILAGAELPDAGEIRLGEGVQVGYFSQEMELLRTDGDLIEELTAVRPMSSEAARSFLARFLFTGEEVFKPVTALSGGERNRLHLAKLLLEEPNALLLDEPTNHLDLASREVVETALLEYGGTVVAVSHDRRFLERIATRILSFDPASAARSGERSTGRAGQQPTERPEERAGFAVRLFPGGYAEFRQWEAERRASKTGSRERSDSRPIGSDRKGEGMGERSTRPAGSGRDQGPHGRAASRQEIGRMEQEIMQLEAELQSLAARLADPSTYQDGEAARRAVLAHQSAEARLAELYESWEAVAEPSSRSSSSAPSST